MKDILYSGTHPTETHPWGLPGLGYVARTKAQTKNTALYVAIKWLLKLKKKQIDDGAYFYTTVEHFTRRYGTEYSGVFRGYIHDDKNGKKYLTFSSNCLMDKGIKMTEEEAKRFIEAQSKKMPSTKTFSKR